MTEPRSLIRVDIYRILAGAFVHPSHERLTGLKELIGDLLKAADGRVARAELLCRLELLKGEIERADQPSLEGEYHRLFATEAPVPPCESSYGLSDKGAILSDVAGFYKAFGLKGGAVEDFVDSIGHELEFMGILILKEAIGKEIGLKGEVSVTVEAQKEFLKSHLGRWYKKFVELLLERTRHPFYKLSGELLSLWLQQEIGEMAIKPDMLAAT